MLIFPPFFSSKTISFQEIPPGPKGGGSLSQSLSLAVGSTFGLIYISNLRNAITSKTDISHTENYNKPEGLGGGGVAGGDTGVASMQLFMHTADVVVHFLLILFVSYFSLLIFFIKICLCKTLEMSLKNRYDTKAYA